MLQNIEAERARHSYTQDAMAKALNISQKTYSAYVREERPIPSDKLILLSRLFKCPVDYLLGLDTRQRDSA